MRLRFLLVIAAAAACALGVIGLAFAHGNSDRSTWFADLNGRNELNATTLQKGAGDPDGSGGAIVTIDGTTLCHGITVRNIDTPVAAHIHRGTKRENGPVVVPLAHPTTGDPGASSGCVAVAAPLAAEIADHPRRFYVNVHTAAYPGGAVRGQLRKH
jgi:hypothetical protein